ncbi:MAG TPA: hypothetical protein VMZ05_07805 [Spirochaetota bacterium]|nr:hypothetical protein [Spirochaetota bacterium]
MGILPIDLQAILVRMDSVRQFQHDGVAIAQTLKAGEMGELARIESTRVNEVKPHPEGNAKIEDEQKKEKSHIREKKEGQKREKESKEEEFEEPYKGTIIDTKR